MEVFKQTSIFNVRSALANNDALMSAAPPGAHGADERCVLHLTACQSHLHAWR